MFGFDDDAWIRRQERLIEDARKAPRGLNAAHLLPGALVTISPNKANGDRSYTDDIFEVLARNNCQVVLSPTCLLRASTSYPKGTNERVGIVIHEHEFYAADQIADVLRGRVQTPSISAEAYWGA